MRVLATIAVAGAVSGCSVSVDPTSWSCASLIGPVIEMSRSRTPGIFEITNPETTLHNNYPADGYRIECSGSAEWSQGSGMIEYGAHVSEGGSVILQYRQK